MEFRLASSRDNELLIELTRATPMLGSVTAYVDRSPDFFALSRLQGDGYKVWIAEDEGEPIGCVTGVSRWVRYNGRKARQLYGCDLKVHPRGRGKKTGKALARHYLQHALREPGYEMAEVEVIAGNNRSLNVVSWMGAELCPTVHAGMAHLYQLMPYRKYRVDPSYVVRRATPEDLPRIRQLLHETYADYQSSPLFDEGELEADLEKAPGFDISCFRVAERGDRMVAAAAFWDQQEMRRTIVSQVDRSTRAVLWGLRLVSPILRLPELPKTGQALRYVFLRYPAIVPGEIEALRALLHAELNALRKERHHQFLWASFHAIDPLREVVRKVWKTSMTTNIFHFAVDESLGLLPEQEAQKRPTYVDFSLI